jgi:hypothetical protein
MRISQFLLSKLYIYAPYLGYGLGGVRLKDYKCRYDNMRCIGKYIEILYNQSFTTGTFFSVGEMKSNLLASARKTPKLPTIYIGSGGGFQKLKNTGIYIYSIFFASTE